MGQVFTCLYQPGSKSGFPQACISLNKYMTTGVSADEPVDLPHQPVTTSKRSHVDCREDQFRISHSCGKGYCQNAEIHILDARPQDGLLGMSHGDRLLLDSRPMRPVCETGVFVVTADWINADRRN
jgi:hypothetical protein